MNTSGIATNRASFTLAEVARATGGTLLRGDASTRTTSVSCDTRTVESGALFIALRGESFDAHQFLGDAQKRGAIAAIAEDSENCDDDQLALIQVKNTRDALGDLARAHREKFDIPVVGVTGSYGKTTTRALIEAALGSKLRVLASRENFNNEIGVPQTLLQLDETHQAAVIEMGMRGLRQIEYLAKVAQPTIGVVTNIGPQHIELLGSMENIARAKSEIFDALAENGIAILPVKSCGEYSHLLHENLREDLRSRAVTFGHEDDADFRVVKTENTDSGVRCEIVNPQSAICNFLLPLPGAHNALNAACALAVAASLGIAMEDAARALEKVEVPGARMRVVKSESRGITIIDDCYNSGPNSVRAALETLRDFPLNGRRVAVLGAMKELGEWSEKEHRAVGEFAAQIFGASGALAGVGYETRVLVEAAMDARDDLIFAWFETAAEAAEELPNFIESGDVILVKGSRSVGLEKAVKSLAA